jgi:hypothetical protein
MAIDQMTLIQMVYDSAFSQLIKTPATKPIKGREPLLSLEFPGQQLEESQYQNPWTPQSTNGSQFATEMLSSLIDAIPLVDTIYVDSGVTVEEMYEFVLGASAIPLPASSTGEIPPNPVNTVLSNAHQLFEQTLLASALQPTLSYHPSYATPGNWADPLAAQSWTSISINSNRTKIKPDSPFLRAGGSKHLQDGIWKVSSELLNSDVSKAITSNPELIKRSQQLNISTARTSATIKEDQQRLPPDRETPESEVLISHPIDQSTSGIQISFRCCRVNINRPWLLKSLLEIKGWTLPGQAAGSLSNGTLQDNSGAFPLLPIGFIAIRDLSISADWGEIDSDIATKAATSENVIGFGPFALSGRYAKSGKGYQSSFDGVTITSPGLQILGWINLVIPYTPPA